MSTNRTPSGMARTWRYLTLLLLLFLAGVGWAGPPSRAVLVVWDTGDESQFERYSLLVKGLKDLRTQGKFDIVAGLDKSIKVYDFKRHADAITRLQLARRQDTPFLAVVAMSADGLPGKVLWGKKVVDAEASLNDLQRHFGLVVKPHTTPTPRPSLSPTPGPTNTTLPTEGWVKQGDRWQHTDGLSVGASTSFIVKERDTALDLRHSVTNLFVSLFPAVGEGNRKSGLASALSAMKTQFPEAQFSAGETTQIGDITIFKQESPPPTNGRATPLVGSVTIGDKSLVFLALVYPASPDGDGRAQLMEVLKSVRLR